MNKMYKLSRSIAKFLVMFVVLQTLSFAADIRIPAKRSGPLASLRSAGKSMDLLTSLKDENGQTLKPADNGRWRDKNFYLPSDAKPNRQARLDFIASIHGKPQQTQAANCTPQPVVQPKPTLEVTTYDSLTVETGKQIFTSALLDPTKGKPYPYEADQSATGIARLNLVGNQLSVQGLKAGNVTFTIWPAGNNKIRKAVNVTVIDPRATTTSSVDSKVKTVLRYFTWLFLFAAIVIGVFILIKVLRDRSQDIKLGLRDDAIEPEQKESDPVGHGTVRSGFKSKRTD